MKKQLEGSWRITHYELIVKFNEVIIDSHKGDCDPNDPDENVKGRIDINYLENNLYSFSLYGWNKTDKIWNVEEKITLVREDNYFYDIHDEKRENPAKINVENKTLIIEYSYETVFNDVVAHQYFKDIFKKVG